VHLDGDLGQVVLPDHRYQAEVDIGQKVAQVVVRIAVDVAQLGQMRAQRVERRLRLGISGSGGDCQADPPGHRLWQGAQRAHQEVKALVAPHVAQIGQPDGAVSGQEVRLCMAVVPFRGLGRADVERLQPRGVDAVIEGDLPHPVGDAEHLVAMGVDQRDHARPAALEKPAGMRVIVQRVRGRRRNPRGLARRR